MARERHLVALREAEGAFGRACEAQAFELQAEEMRLAQAALGRITGEVSADDLVGEIFSRFCIGKCCSTWNLRTPWFHVEPRPRPASGRIASTPRRIPVGRFHRPHPWNFPSVST